MPRNYEDFSKYVEDIPGSHQKRLSFPGFLKFDFKNLTLEDTCALVDFIHAHPEITALGVKGKNIGSIGAQRLCVLKQLTWLDISDNDIGPQGIAALSALTQLTWLNVAGNKIGAEGARALLAFKELTTLNASDNEMDDEGIRQLSSLKNLKTLDITHNKIAMSTAVSLVISTEILALKLTTDEGTDALKRLIARNKKIAEARAAIIHYENSLQNKTDPYEVPRAFWEAFSKTAIARDATFSMRMDLPVPNFIYNWSNEFARYDLVSHFDVLMYDDHSNEELVNAIHSIVKKFIKDNSQFPNAFLDIGQQIYEIAESRVSRDSCDVDISIARLYALELAFYLELEKREHRHEPEFFRAKPRSNENGLEFCHSRLRGNELEFLSSKLTRDERSEAFSALFGHKFIRFCHYLESGKVINGSLYQETSYQALQAYPKFRLAWKFITKAQIEFFHSEKKSFTHRNFIQKEQGQWVHGSRYYREPVKTRYSYDDCSLLGYGNELEESQDHTFIHMQEKTAQEAILYIGCHIIDKIKSANIKTPFSYIDSKILLSREARCIATIDTIISEAKSRDMQPNGAGWLMAARKINVLIKGKSDPLSRKILRVLQAFGETDKTDSLIKNHSRTRTYSI